MAAAGDDLVCEATELRKVHPQIASARIGATVKRNPLTNPAFVSFATSGSRPDMQVSTMMDEVCGLPPSPQTVPPVNH